MPYNILIDFAVILSIVGIILIIGHYMELRKLKARRCKDNMGFVLYRLKLRPALTTA